MHPDLAPVAVAMSRGLGTFGHRPAQPRAEWSVIVVGRTGSPTERPFTSNRSTTVKW